MSAIERAMNHYESLGKKSLEVKAWGLTVYWTPLTLIEKARIIKPGQAIAETVWADVLIHKALDADGKPLFELKDREHLMRGVDGAILQEVGRAIMGAALDVDAVDVAEKN